jgi:hypothetical protein
MSMTVGDGGGPGSRDFVVRFGGHFFLKKTSLLRCGLEKELRRSAETRK